MAFEPYVRVKCSMRETQNIDNGVAKSFESLSDNPLLGSLTQIQGVSIGTTDTVVEHRLGRSYNGYIVTRRDTNSVVFDSPTVNENTKDYALLRASTPVTVTLLFY